MIFTTILSEGNLIPADLLEQIATGEASGQRPEDFGLEKSRRLIDEIAAAFIVPRVLELVYTAWDMRPFAEDVWAEAGGSGFRGQGSGVRFRRARWGRRTQ